MHHKAPLIVILALLAFSMPTNAATGQQCDTMGGQVTGAGVIFSTTWCGPSEATQGSDFQVVAQAQLSVAGLTLNIPAASSWTYIGCSYVSATTGGGTLTASTIVRVTMNAPTCTITTTVGVLPLIGAALGNYPLLYSIYDPTADLPTTFNANLSGEVDFNVLSWPQLNATLGGDVSVALDGTLTLDGIPTAYTVTNDGTLTLDGIPTEYTIKGIGPGQSIPVNVTGVSIDQNFDNATLNNTFEDSWAPWLPVFFFAGLILYGESRHNSFATFVGVFGLISEFVVGGVASRSFFIFLGMLSVAFSSWMKAWFGKRGKT